MSKNTKPALTNSLPISESTPSAALNVKAMFGRIWSVAELLAEVGQRETRNRSNQVSRKTQH